MQVIKGSKEVILLDLDNLPIDILKWLKNLKQGNAVYRSDIQTAFDIATSFDEAVGICTIRMDQQIAEAKSNIKWLKDHQKSGDT